MTLDEVIASLDIPREALVQQRIAKKMLIDNMSPTAADKKQINDGIEELTWVAALKPNTVGVSEYKDNEKEILEIAILALILRETKKKTRLIELIHRAIPYPVFLIVSGKEGISLSIATKRWSQNEGGKTVLDTEPLTVDLEGNCFSKELLHSISLKRLPRVDLNGLYLAWKSCLEALKASAYTEKYLVSQSLEVVEARRLALDEAERVQQELVALKAQAQRETQMNRRVELNLEIKNLETRLNEAKRNMS